MYLFHRFLVPDMVNVNNFTPFNISYAEKKITKEHLTNYLKHAINNKERPNYLSRSKNTSTGLDEPLKPKFTRSVKSKPF